MAVIAADLQRISGGTAVLEPALNYEAIPWYQFAVPWNNLNTSENQGTARLLADIASYRSGGCDQRTIMLAGYSQGAEVIIKAVDQLPADVRSTLSIALLGNPSFTPNRTGDVDYNTAGQGIRPSLHQGRYLLPNDVLARTRDVCAKGDPICSFRPLVWLAQTIALADGRSAHYAYVKLGYADTAAQFLWDHRYRYPAPTIRTPILEDGTVGESYVDFLDTDDGRSGTWTLRSGTLPPGLSLDRLGMISGTPTVVGSYSFTIQFTDFYAQSVTGAFTINIRPVAGPPPPPEPGAAYSFGVDTSGELGQGQTGYDRGISPNPLLVNGLSGGITGVAAAGSSGFAVNSDGTAEAWGYGGGGELAQGNTRSSLTPVSLPLSGVQKIAADGEGVLALLIDGSVRTWGEQGDSAPSLDPSCYCYTSPKAVALPGKAVDIAVGWDAFYVALADGTVWAWGVNTQGQLGNGTVSDCYDCQDSWTPVKVSGLSGVTAISAGFRTAYALTNDGTVWAWGQGTYGELGPNAGAIQPVPVAVTGLPAITQIAASGAGDAYALAADHSVWAWGDNSHGALGNGTSGASGGAGSSTAPVRVTGLNDATSIGAGGRQTFGSAFAVRADGTLWSWGCNRYGQLGYPTGTYPYFADQLVPAHISGLENVKAVTEGTDTTYVVADAPPAAP